MNDDTVRARRDALLHARLRWCGALLLPVALGSLFVHGWLVWRGAEPTGRMMLGVFATLVSLGAFGTNDDSMLEASRRAGASLPAPLAGELDREVRVRPARVRDATAHPRAGRILPVVATVAVAWAWWRAGQGMGWWS